MANENLISSADKGGLALIKGSYEEMLQQSSELLDNVNPEDCLIIDASEVFSIININQYEEAPPLDNVFAPVTAFQLKEFVEKDLENMVINMDCKLILVSSMRNLFFDPNINEEEYSKIFSEILTNLRKIAAEHGVFVVTLDFIETFDNSRDATLTNLLEISSDWVIRPNNSSEVSLFGVEKCVV